MEEFESYDKKIPYSDFFDFLEGQLHIDKDDFSAAQIELEDALDPEKRAHIYLSSFGDFCRHRDIPWKSKYSRMQSRVNKRAKSMLDHELDGDEVGETYNVEGMKYKLVPERDYYRGVSTILNSESAALVVADKIFNSVEKGDKFLDKDFGPRHEDDYEGKVKALYFGAKGPPGYADPKSVVWRHVEELTRNPQFIDDGASAGDVK
jgi:hypothetical protein